jgi:hypothetical protein
MPIPFIAAIGGVKGAIMGGLVIVLLLGGGAFYLYYKTSQATILSLYKDVATAEANTERVKDEIKGLNQSIRLLETQQVNDQKKMLVLADKARIARGEVEELKAKFKEHDLGRLSSAKPGLIERIINRGTKKVWTDFESLTEIPEAEKLSSPPVSVPAEVTE